MSDKSDPRQRGGLFSDKIKFMVPRSECAARHISQVTSDTLSGPNETFMHDVAAEFAPTPLGCIAYPSVTNFVVVCLVALFTPSRRSDNYALHSEPQYAADLKL